jgi:hypothetical protein
MEVAEVVATAAERVAAGRRLPGPLVHADHPHAQLVRRLPRPRRARFGGGGRSEDERVRERRAVRSHVVGAGGDQERGEGERGGQPAGRAGAGPRAARAGVGVRSPHERYSRERGRRYPVVALRATLASHDRARRDVGRCIEAPEQAPNPSMRARPSGYLSGIFLRGIYLTRG